MGGKALIAMSGGVDSSVAAYLMKRAGFECVGVTLRLFDGGGSDAGDAREVSDALGIAHHVFDLSDEFEEFVVSRFVEAYQNGATPNPCILCNRHIKFGALLGKAEELGAECIATGHYARVGYGAGGGCNAGAGPNAGVGRYFLKKALDEKKDQSYVLYSLTQRQLGQIRFPLGGLTKAEVRDIAAAEGFVSAGRRESQDICFVPDGDYAGFIERRTGGALECGDFVDTQGNVLGRHKGQLRYTVGQRRGLGLAAPEPLYVLSKDARANTVTLCGNDGLYSKTIEAEDFNWIAFDCTDASISSPIRAMAKIRYSHTGQWATVHRTSPGTVRVEFDEPQRAAAKGQAVVLYDGDTVIGGGTIV